jgi:hypothetical protein
MKEVVVCQLVYWSEFKRVITFYINVGLITRHCQFLRFKRRPENATEEPAYEDMLTSAASRERVERTAYLGDKELQIKRKLQQMCQWLSLGEVLKINQWCRRRT